MTEADAHAQLDEFLADVVTAIVGSPEAVARPGQVALAHDILEAMTTPGGQVVGAAPTGLGKALDVATPIATPKGWTTMGQIEPGDQVFDEAGRPCEDLAVSPVLASRPCFEVVFSTGESLVADEEHLWATATREVRAALADERRAQARGSATDLPERAERLRALRHLLAASPDRTYAEACRDLRGLAHGTTISRVRKRLGGRRLARGEPFDVLPVIDRLLTDTDARTLVGALARPHHVVLSTSQMRDTIRAADGSRNHAVPVAAPLALPPAGLLVDPYLLGAWLGDGTSRAGAITIGGGDVEAMTALVGAAWRGRVTRTAHGTAWTLACLQPDADRCPYGHEDWRAVPRRNSRLCRACARGERDGERWNTGLTENLRVLGVLRSKHIPADYLRASADQRLAVLQGLMDTDGTVSAAGRAELCVTSERLARDAYELASTLGIRAVLRSGSAKMTQVKADGSRTRVACGIRWRVGFTTDLPVFRLQRKAERLMAHATSCGTRRAYRYVTEIRPVQSRPVRCIAVSSPSRLYLAGRSLIPTHNSISYGVPAALVAATEGERTVISTESLALQAQIVDKDMPVVTAAARRLHGITPQVAVLKGWGNYACLHASIATAQVILGEASSAKHVSLAGAAHLADRVDEFVAAGADATGPLAALLGGPGATVELDGRDVPLEDLAPLVTWALREHTVTGAPTPGDRHSYPGKTSDGIWGAVAVSPAECVGTKQCPFADVCKPAAAKRLAADADIVVTNHSMLATQAANDLAVVVGSRTLGKFDHIVIDEAHALPAQVRSQGAKEVSGRRVLSVMKAMRGVLDDRDPRVKGLLDEGAGVADQVDAELSAVLARATGREATVKLVEGDDPVRATGAMFERWLENCGALLSASTRSARGDAELKSRRARGRVDSLKADLKAVSDHRVGVARWVNADARGAGRPWAAAHSSPVEIGGMLHGNLWTAPVPDDEDAPEESEDLSAERIVGKDGRPRYELSVVAVSATLPGGFAREMGLRAQPGEYPSPFEAAYGASALYVPRATERDDVMALASPYSTGRARFDVKAHAQWVLPHLGALVDANGGSALVLAAKADDGRAYAEFLRAQARGRWEVLSQWDGTALRQTTAAWRENHHAVLVGTRSLMTGVDAPGDTCSLVVLDRPPRAAGNVVDDARVEALMSRLDTDKWSADRLVYCADAALLLEQAAGRLIRSMTDSGMVAVLDPRLLKVGPYRYQEQTRQVYMRALARFPRKLSRLEDATAFLRARRADRPAA